VEQVFEMDCKLVLLIRKTMLNQLVPAFEDIEKVEVVYRKTV